MTELLPDRFVIDCLQWQAFGTLTFRKSINHRKAVGLFLRVLRRAELLWQMKQLRSFYFLRFEQGEMTGREHFHFLVGGFPSRQLGGFKMEKFTTSGCLWFVHEWSCLVSGGFARVRPYTDLHDSASNYILKGIANRYELNKFTHCRISEHLVSNALGNNARQACSEARNSEAKAQTGLAKRV